MDIQLKALITSVISIIFFFFLAYVADEEDELKAIFYPSVVLMLISIVVAIASFLAWIWNL